MNTKLHGTLLGLTLLCLSGAAAASDKAADTAAAETNPIDPQAAEIVLRSAYFLADLPVFSFSWFLSSDEVVDDREKITFVESGSTTVKRGTGFYSSRERGNTYRDYYFNGKEFSVVSPNENFYASAPFTGTYDDLMQRVQAGTGTTLPIWTILSTDLPAKLVAGVEAAAYLGTTHIAGQEVHHVAFTSPDEDWQIWISTDDDAPFPLMLIGTRTDLKGWPQQRVTLMDWNLAPNADAERFKFTPDKGSIRVTFPMPADADTGNAAASKEGGR